MVRILAALFFSAVCAQAALAGAHLKSVPDAPDPDGRYVFYLHSGFLESNPNGAAHPRSGTPYDWSGIVDALVKRGFYVISEIRPQGTRPPHYARKVAQQIGALIRAEVAPERITMAGHSKGGAITLLTAALMSNPRVNFINMAGCGASGRFAKQFRRFVNRMGSDINGRVLSLHDSYDEIAGSCADIKDAGAPARFNEIVLKTQQGHELFYSPKNAWLGEVEKFANSAG